MNIEEDKILIKSGISIFEKWLIQIKEINLPEEEKSEFIGYYNYDY